ncbi:MAG: hypothetical protein ABI353_07490 [Isosphaeraceae bacterium]
MTYVRKTVACLAVTVILTTWGCSGGGSTPSVSSSSAETAVKGTVTINGKPATGGEVLFDPANINRKDAPAQKMPIGEDGTFSGKSLVGENSVTVSGPEIGEGALSMNRKVVDLKAGENSVDITLP